MKLVLLSGGSGKRLWPLSNDSRSKQFLKVLKNSFNENESMVQRVWGQLNSSGLAGSSIIATSKSQVDMIHNQIGKDVPIVIEPERRDTFAAIALAATYYYSIRGAELNEVITILPVDPYVKKDFFEKVKEMEKLLLDSEADIVLLGVNPTFPSEKYGYIVPEKNNSNNWTRVNRFIEKPKTSIATNLIKQGAMWNCGVFAFKLDYIISILKEKNLPTQYEELANEYLRIPKNSFDYEVVEKANNIIALKYSGYWKDLGTWNTLTDEMKTHQIGKGVISKDCRNVHLINELDIPIAVIGTSSLVIAASPDGILVTDKEKSPQIKSVIEHFDQRPMFEERKWGWYKVLDHSKIDNGQEVLTKRIGIIAGENLSYQLHYKRSEVWTVIKGEGEFAFNGEIKRIQTGDVIQIPVESKHGLRAITDMEIIEVQRGSELIEEDIVRIYTTWSDTINNCILLNLSTN